MLLIAVVQIVLHSPPHSVNIQEVFRMQAFLLCMSSFMRIAVVSKVMIMSVK